MKEHIHGSTKKSRRNKIMAIQQQISKEKLEKYIGKEFEALIDDVSSDGNYYIGRTYMDVADEDGVVFIINNIKGLKNKFVRVKITDVLNYDLIGEIVK